MRRKEKKGGRERQAGSKKEGEERRKRKKGERWTIVRDEKEAERRRLEGKKKGKQGCG